MEEQLLGFPKQFSWEPVLEGDVAPYTSAIVCGMGGSALQAKLLLSIDPSLPFSIHQDYGLPFISSGEKPLIILSSYSGDTEEVLDSAKEAGARGLPRAIIASGGALLTLARAENIPYIELPKENIQPRMAIGYAMLALLRVLGKTEEAMALRTAGSGLNMPKLQSAGAIIADTLKNHAPLIYTSTANSAIGYVWKITFNETAKIPAFVNVVPELCHNELNGFDVAPTTATLSQNMLGVFLHDSSDHPRNEKRLTLVADIMKEKGVASTQVEILGNNRYEKVLSGALTGVAVALSLAHTYGVPDAEVPMVQDFKKTPRMILVADVGGTTMRIACVGEDGELKNVQVHDTPQIYSDGIAHFLAYKESLNAAAIETVSIGIAGEPNADHTSLIGAAHLKDWVEKPLAHDLEKIFGAPVLIENDTVMGALGEAKQGAGVGAERVAYIAIGTGIGGRLVVNGAVQEEDEIGIGHQPVEIDGITKEFEAFVSGSAITKERGCRPSELTDTTLWDGYARAFAYGLHKIILDWKATRVVLGGSLAQESMLSIGRVEKYLKEIGAESASPEIVYAELPYPGLTGAYLYAKAKRYEI